MIKAARLYLRLLSVQLRSQLQYPASFALDFFASLITGGMAFVSVALVIARFDGIAGWTPANIAVLWGMVEMSFGIMDMVFSGFDPDAFSPMVRTGSFDQVLLRPVNVTLQVLGSRFIIRRLGRIAQGALILTYGLTASGIDWTLGKALYLPVIAFSQVLFFGGLFIAGSTLTFWTVQPIEAVNILTYGGTELSSYPITVFPNWMQRFFTYVVPTVFISYAPALYILDKPDPLGLPAFASFLTPLAAATVLGASLLFWRFGLRHYQSTGT